MATNSLLGVDRAPTYATGRDSDLLGPSDSSDSGSDVQGEMVFDDIDDGGNPVHHSRHIANGATDGAGTGERGSAPDAELVQDGADILPDSIERLGGMADDDADIDALDGDLTDLAELVADDPYQEDGEDGEEGSDSVPESEPNP